jgi:outer membrane receptor for ferrienterochelin and colicin
MTVRSAAARIVLMLAVPALAHAQGATQNTQQQQQPPQSDQAQQPPPTYEEQVVITASKSEEQLVNAPAAVSVISPETIQNSPGTNVGDLLRTVPGVNVSQVSARDVNITTRGAPRRRFPRRSWRSWTAAASTSIFSEW